MSEYLPKEKMSAYMRWEVASFDEPATSRLSARDNRPTIEELAAIRDDARQKGHAEGYADGHSDGYAKGHAKGMQDGSEEGRSQAAVELARLGQLAGSFAAEISLADERMTQQLLDLALDLAKAMIKSSLEVRPELVVPVVAEAIRYLPAVQQPALLHLHPADAVLVTGAIGDELAKTGWRILDDQQIARGGCRVDTASNQIDATAQTRWQRIAAALSRDNDWLGP